MNKTYEKCQVLALLSLLASAPAAHAQTEPLAITNVDVIPIAEPGVLEAQSVVIEDGVITELGAADDVTIPEGATVIDGSDKFLMPGLSDMHVHTDGLPDALTLNLANGITRIQALNAVPSDLEVAAKVRSGDILGPQMITAPHAIGLPDSLAFVAERWNFALAPAFNVDDLVAALHEWPIVVDEASAREFMEIVIAGGADSIKTNLNLPREAFDIYIAESGLLVQGHISGSIGVEHFIESGAHVHHVSELSHYVSSNGHQGEPLMHWNFDLTDENLPTLIELMVDNGTYFTPTVDLGWYLRATLQDAEAVTTAPEVAFMPPEVQAMWQDLESNVVTMFFGGDEGAQAAADYNAYAEQLLMASLSAGVPLMTGTDCTAVPGMVCGFALHNELMFMVELGMSEQEALTASTLTPARFLGEEEESGTVAVGKRADLLLLDASPLESIHNTREIAGVVRTGRWLPREELDAMLAELSERYAD